MNDILDRMRAADGVVLAAPAYAGGVPGAMTDFGPLIANPKSFLLGAAAQFGIFAAYFGAIALGFNDKAAAAISIIGGADGPTSIFLAGKLGQTALLGPIAVAAYSYMSLVPIIQPPIMKLLTTEKERKIKMGQLRPVSKLENHGETFFKDIGNQILVTNTDVLQIERFHACFRMHHAKGFHLFLHDRSECFVNSNFYIVFGQPVIGGLLVAAATGH